jgi:hypothetical protein
MPSEGVHLPSEGVHLPSLGAHLPCLDAHLPSLGAHLPSLGVHLLLSHRVAQGKKIAIRTDKGGSWTPTLLFGEGRRRGCAHAK